MRTFKPLGLEPIMSLCFSADSQHCKQIEALVAI